jgi:hypothetical protein
MNASDPMENGFEKRSDRRNAVRAATARSFGDHRACCREILRLNNENARLADELARLRARNEDLTTSAYIWIRLYEALLARARQPQTRASFTSTEGSRS